MDTFVYESLDRSAYRSERNRLRRMKIVRRRIIMLVLTVILILICAISYQAIRSEASSIDKETNYKYYTSIEVAYGDSLWSIAEDYYCDEYDSVNDYLSEVKSINHISNDDIYAGQCLIIPYYSILYK